MPDVQRVEVDPPSPPVIVTETVTEVPPPPLPEDLEPVEPPTAVLDPDTADLLRGLVEDMDGFSETLEGTSSETGGPVVLDGDQFGVLGIGLVLILAVLTALFVLNLRR